jgi:NAD dependent epimerase/dehydratase
MTLKSARVLVTGADGFIGSHLTAMLVEYGAKVTALSYYNSFNHWGWLETLPRLKEIKVVSGDVRDPNFCRELVRDIDVIFHLAALIPIPYSYVAPDSFVDTNVRGTLNICQAARAAGVSKLIHTSTSEVYGSALYVPIDEKHPLQAQSPYSATKIGADAIAYSFWAAFGLPVLTARPFNTYGPRQSARAVIPSIIIQLAAGKREISLGTLKTTRDFTFVEDTCRGFLALGELDGHGGEVFNIGSNIEISVGDTFNHIARILQSDSKIVEDAARLRPENSEVMRLCCDNRKLREASGFQPSVSIEDGLRKTCDWFRDPQNLKQYKSDLYNV